MRTSTRKLVLLLVVSIGCGRVGGPAIPPGDQASAEDANPSHLSGLLIEIPIYPGSKFLSSDQFNSLALGGGESEECRESIWYLRTDDPLEKVAQFYESRLPKAKKDHRKPSQAKQPRRGDDDEEDMEEISLTIYPPGWSDSEYVSVRLTDKQIMIHQSVLASRR